MKASLDSRGGKEVASRGRSSSFARSKRNKVESWNSPSSTSDKPLGFGGQRFQPPLFRSLSFRASLALPHAHIEHEKNKHAHAQIPPLPPPPRKPAAAAPPSAAGETSGLRHLGPAGVARATDPKANPFEKKKNAKSGAQMWTEVYELAELLKSGQSTWEDLDLDDVDVRLKVRESDEQNLFWSFSHPLLSVFPPPHLSFFSGFTPQPNNSGSASSTAGSAPQASS